MDQQARSDIYICIYIYSIYWSGVDVDTSCVVWFWEFQQRMLQLYKMSRGYHQPTYLWDNPQHHLLFSCPNSKPYAIHQKNETSWVWLNHRPHWNGNHPQMMAADGFVHRKTHYLYPYQLVWLHISCPIKKSHRKLAWVNQITFS